MSLASSPTPQPAPPCPYYQHRNSGFFNCTLEGYCDWYRDAYDPLEIACVGDLPTEHAFDLTFRRSCATAKTENAAWYEAGDEYCMDVSNKRSFDGYQRVSQLDTRRFTSGEALSVEFEREYHYCDGNNSLWCSCDASFEGLACQGCSICGRYDEDGDPFAFDNYMFEYDCTNIDEGLMFTCEKRNTLDFIFQAARIFSDREGGSSIREPSNCDYFRDRSVGGPLVCTLREYCDWIVEENDPVRAVCTGDLLGRHTMKFSYDEKCEETKSRKYTFLTEDFCRNETRTLVADGMETVKWAWSDTFNGDLNVVFDREVTVCDDNDKDKDDGDSASYCSCRVHINKRECGCQVCDDQPDGYVNLAYDCSNLEPQSEFSWHRTDNLKKSCYQKGWEGDLDFLLQAEEVLPEYDPNYDPRLGESGTIVATTLWVLALVMVVVALAFDVRAAVRAQNCAIRHHRLYLFRHCNETVFLAFWIGTMISGTTGLRLAIETATGKSCSLGESLSFRSDCEAEDNSVGMILVLTFFPILYIMTVWDFRSSPTRNKLRTIDTTESVGRYMARLYAAYPISIQLTISCFHTTFHSVWNGPNATPQYTTWMRQNVTHQESEAVNVLSSSDCTTNKVSDETLEGCDVFEVRVEKTVEGDERFKSQEERFLARNKNRDSQYSYNVDIDLGKCVSGIVLYRDTSKMRGDLSEWVGFLCHFLVLPALPYRIWVNSQVGTLKPQVTKRITTAD